MIIAFLSVSYQEIIKGQTCLLKIAIIIVIWNESLGDFQWLVVNTTTLLSFYHVI